jgi:hypothetical protein
MAKGKSSSRKTQKIVRAPATKFSHLQKKTRASRDHTLAAGKKPKSGIGKTTPWRP